MKTKFKGILTLLLAFIVQITFAQEKTISGKVSDENGPLPGVSVLKKGTSQGVETDFDGNYKISAKTGDVLVFSFVGMETVEKAVGNTTKIDVSMSSGNVLDEIVVTALGIKREKKSLGYSTQEVKGDAVSTVKSSNFVNSLSGQVAGLDVKTSGTIGGSTNVVIRGNSSLLGNNQALFVVDGIPIGNGNTNSSDQKSGRGGYDYGNAASDINPDDIESINVLKGAAASALYGSRGSNGVIMITTKKGKSRKGIGVTVNSSLMMSKVDNQTLPVYQKKYGAGYGPYYDSPDGYFSYEDFNEDGTLDLVTPFTEDASFGALFDSNKLVYQWNSIFPELSTYKKATPWVAGANDPNSVWETGSTYVNSVALQGGGEKSTFRLGYTNMTQNGNLPNSSIKRNSINLSGSLNLTEKLTTSIVANYTKTNGKGRYGTGYDSNNVMQQFRQWWQTNVDVQEQREAYFSTKKNVTWNTNSSTNLRPIYSDNPYWTFYENYETDERNRYYGNVVLDYKFTDWLSVLGRFTYDTYSELQEERTNVGSANVSKYSRYNNNVAEYNYDVIASFNKDLSERVNLDGNIGFNLRTNTRNSIDAQTNGGLSLEGLYSLSNSYSSPESPSEYSAKQYVDGIYARASLGLDDTYFVEGTARRDRNSSLPIDNNTYFYYSATGSVILSKLIKQDWLSFAKLRGNYGTVGAGTNPYRVFDTYVINTPFGTPSASASSVKNNLDLKSERQNNWEIGLEASLFKKRLGFDVTYYQAKNTDQITRVPVSSSTGVTAKYLNAGTIQNKGTEIQLYGTPVKTDDFSWDININWSQNKNKLLSLVKGIENLELASFQGGISINAAPGMPVGLIRGTDIVYHENGQPIIIQEGAGSRVGKYQVTSTSNNVIGDTNPDWTGGLRNTFKYKNLSFSFLIDMQKGGDVFSLDTWYGYGTGLYDFTAGTNELGNPVRNSIADGGGVLLQGVAPDGTTNTVRASADTYANPWGWSRSANSQHVYDAGFIKLREANLTYNLDSDVLKKTPFTSASISLIGRNLWIIDKSVPFADPESGLSSGNVQGYQSGSYPAVKEFGANIKLQF